MDLKEYKKKIANLSVNEQKLRDLYLRDMALGKVQGPPTGYASIDKPWLKYYSEEHIMADIPHMTAYEYLRECNKDNMNLNAIDSDFGNFTYEEMFREIDRTASALYKLGVEKGDKILTVLPVLPQETFLFYGIDKVGAAMCPLAPQTTPEEICKYINKFETEYAVLFSYFLTPEIEKTIYEKTNLKHIINIDFIGNKLCDDRTILWNDFIAMSNGVTLPNVNRNPEDLLFITSTGGSTGEPKCVMLNDDCFNIIVHQFINSDVNYNVGDKWIRLWPIFSAAAAVSNHHLPFCTGGCDLLRNFPMNILDFDKMILNDKPNHTIMIPQLIDVLEQSELLKNEDLSFVKTAGCGGLAITPQFEERVNKFYKDHNINTFLGYGWGCTEHSSSVAMRSNFETTSIGTAGAPMVKTVVSVFDPLDMSEKTYGEEGELCISSATIMMGYYGDEEMTNRVVKQHADGSVWLHTGDLGTISEDGIVSVKGRMTRMIFVFPTAKVYPQALESSISKVSGVQEVVVGEIPDEEHEGFYLPVCFVVPEKDADIEVVKENINSMCDETMADYARPKTIYFKEKFPLTKVGKPDVRKLEAELQSNKDVSKIKKL